MAGEFVNWYTRLKFGVTAWKLMSNIIELFLRFPAEQWIGVDRTKPFYVRDENFVERAVPYICETALYNNSVFYY